MACAEGVTRIVLYECPNCLILMTEDSVSKKDSCAVCGFDTKDFNRIVMLAKTQMEVKIPDAMKKEIRDFIEKVFKWWL